jgi:hypothetical protein
MAMSDHTRAFKLQSKLDAALGGDVFEFAGGNSIRWRGFAGDSREIEVDVDNGVAFVGIVARRADGSRSSRESVDLGEFAWTDTKGIVAAIRGALGAVLTNPRRRR